MPAIKPQGAKVLLVDDDASLLKLLAIRIESKGYEVTTCESGLNGWHGTAPPIAKPLSGIARYYDDSAWLYS